MERALALAVIFVAFCTSTALSVKYEITPRLHVDGCARGTKFSFQEMELGFLGCCRTPAAAALRTLPHGFEAVNSGDGASAPAPPRIPLLTVFTNEKDDLLSWYRHKKNPTGCLLFKKDSEEFELIPVCVLSVDTAQQLGNCKGDSASKQKSFLWNDLVGIFKAMDAKPGFFDEDLKLLLSLSLRITKRITEKDLMKAFLKNFNNISMPNNVLKRLIRKIPPNPPIKGFISYVAPSKPLNTQDFRQKVIASFKTLLRGLHNPELAVAKDVLEIINAKGFDRAFELLSYHHELMGLHNPPGAARNLQGSFVHQIFEFSELMKRLESNLRRLPLLSLTFKDDALAPLEQMVRVFDRLIDMYSPSGLSSLIPHSTSGARSSPGAGDPGRHDDEVEAAADGPDDRSSLKFVPLSTKRPASESVGNENATKAMRGSDDSSNQSSPGGSPGPCDQPSSTWNYVFKSSECLVPGCKEKLRECKEHNCE